MGLSKFVVKTPSFAHPEGALCGPHCAKFILAAQGKEWTASWPPAVLPTFPSRLVKLLAANGQAATTVSVSRRSRLAWIKEKLRDWKTLALFVRPNGLVPFPTHWVVACGSTGGGKILIYDDRIGDTASSPDLPIGNAVWTEEQLLQLWQAAPLFRWTSTAVVPF